MTLSPVAVDMNRIALIGNPNSGKTTLFNALTGLRQKVGNYPGVTVEKKEGRMVFDDGSEASVLDLPGTYSLTANSPDEQISTDILLGRATHTPPPALVVCVVDASNLERNLYLVSQIIDRGVPLVIALNMMDVAGNMGVSIDLNVLAGRLGVPIIPTIASKGIGIGDLRQAMKTTRSASPHARAWALPEPVGRECDELVGLLQEYHQLPPPVAFHEAIMLLSSANGHGTGRFAPELLAHVRKDHAKLDFLGIDRQSVFVEARYAWIHGICRGAVTRVEQHGASISDRIDDIVTHRVWGFVVFFGLMALLFQTIFSWSDIPMTLIGDGFDQVGQQITRVMPAGDLRDLIVNGGLAGVAAVVTFLPQILFLFFFLALLEDTGYMARAAFIMDRLMGRVGLNGKSFIPLLGSFACAIPGIMATRTIENPRDRLVTILVAPLMSCSARLPVYTLMIAAFVPDARVAGVLSLAGITMFAMYALGLVAALGMARLFRSTLLRGKPTAFIMELPPYKLPSVRSILMHMWERSVLFLKKAGTIILGVSVVLWFLATYPRLEGGTPSERLQHSFAGQAGHMIEPLIRPLGFDWRIGIGLVGSILQREVFVSTMGTIYNIQDSDSDGSVSLQEKLRNETDPVTGKHTFTLLTALCVMVYYVLAMQCLSTVAVVRRETNGWKWPMIQFGYMTALAYGVTLLVYHGGQMLGIGG